MTPALRGILLMTAGISVLSIMDGAVKWLVIRDISSIQIIALRGWLISLFILVVLLLIPRRKNIGIGDLKTVKWKHHIGRSLVGVFAPMLFFLSLKTIPLANAVSIFFSTTFIMTAGSQWFLGEHVGVHRWSAVVVGFIGVLIILQPATAEFEPASLLVLIASAAYAFILISGRSMSRTESSLQLIFYFTFCNTLICSAILLLSWPTFWHTMTREEVLVLAGLSAIALTGYFFITRAFTIAPISVIAPIEYIALPWALLIGYVIWDEKPSDMVWLGITLILGAGLYIAWRESRQPR